MSERSDRFGIGLKIRQIWGEKNQTDLGGVKNQTDLGGEKNQTDLGGLKKSDRLTITGF